MAREWQFDGLVGPTHNYAGLALGNLAAAKNAGEISNPRAAALQGLQKMKYVLNLGLPQAFLPPHYRPALWALRELGFGGGPEQILSTAYTQRPGLLAGVYSSSFMWTANAATVTPSCDSGDSLLHLSPANLTSHFHRSIEAKFTTKLLQTIFHNQKLFKIHNAIFGAADFGDEGAANHMVSCRDFDSKGTHFFVYGQDSIKTIKTSKYPSRQLLPASEAIARRHLLDPKQCVFLQQHPVAIDQGVFHNDVIAMNTTSKMVIHEQAFIPEHQELVHKICAEGGKVHLREVKASELSVADAVSTYLFNSQMLVLPGGKVALVAPAECEIHTGVRQLIGRFLEEGVIDEVHYLGVRESMRNGGGPACLRLRVVMNPEQEQAIHSGIIVTDAKLAQLEKWILTYYRDRLSFNDLRDPQLLGELDRAYSALETLLGMPGLYDGFRYYE